MPDSEHQRKIKQLIAQLTELYNEGPPELLANRIKLLGKVLRLLEKPKMREHSLVQENGVVTWKGIIQHKMPDNARPTYFTELEGFVRNVFIDAYLQGQKDLIEDIELLTAGRDVTALYPFDSNNWKPKTKKVKK